jgi:voltage-gated potassium channel
MPPAAPGPSRAVRRHPTLPPGAVAQRVGGLSVAAAATGLILIGLGIASAAYPFPELYRDPFAGYDPPFAVVAGLVLIVLAPRVLERTPFAWLFSLLAPILTSVAAVLSPNVYSVAGAVASIVFVGAIFPYRSGFYRGLAQSPRATELAVIVAGLLSLLFGTVGARWLGGEFQPNIRGWAQALYFTVTTVSTNGSTIEPATNTARLFVVALILLGVGTFLSAIVVLFIPFVERRLSGLTARLERAQMQELEDHVIVCGASAEAHATARALRAAGARAVILSSDSQALELLRSEGFRTHLGDPSAEDDLKEVGIERARALIVAQASDAENLLTVITARAIQPSLRIVAIASSDSSLPKLRRAGASEAVSVVGVAAQLMSSAALETTSGDGPHPHTILP